MRLHYEVVILGLCILSLVGCGATARSWAFKSSQPAVDSPSSHVDFDPLTADVPVKLPNASEPVTAAAQLSQPKIAVGGTTTLVVRLKTAKPWTIYAIDNPEDTGTPTRLELTLPSGLVQQSDWSFPTAKTKDSPFGPVQYYSDDVRFSVPLTTSASAKAGPAELLCTVHYQACSDATCTAPTSQRLTIPLVID